MAKTIEGTASVQNITVAEELARYATGRASRYFTAARLATKPSIRASDAMWLWDEASCEKPSRTYNVGHNR